MKVPFTFRKRLLGYTLFLMVVLIGFLLFFYGLGREVILQTADRNSELAAKQAEQTLYARNLELDRYLRMISENLQLREYMFVVTSIGGDKQSLQKLFDRLYGWLPFSRVMFLSAKGEPLAGIDDLVLINYLKQQDVIGKTLHTSLYFETNNRLDLVKVAPMYYQKQYLGQIVIFHDLADDLVSTTLESKYGGVFVVRDGTVIRSTLTEAEGKPFQVKNGNLQFSGQHFRLRSIKLPVVSEHSRVWFGLSDAELLATLEQSERLMLSLALFASLAIIAIAYLAFNRFSSPMSRLVELMEKVGEGRLPNVGDVNTNDEIGYLTHQFKDMVSSLRKQQREIDKVHEKLEQQATTDELTGFYNRRFLYNIFPKLWSDANRQRKSIGVILADLDHFKLVNDTHGHLVGDEILKQFAAIIIECSRVSDFLIRLGGEEFLILTSEGIEAAQVLAEKIRSRLERTPMRTESGKIKVTCSFGIAQAEISDGKDSLSAVLRRADLALYQAKDSGRNRVATWDETLKRS